MAVDNVKPQLESINLEDEHEKKASEYYEEFSAKKSPPELLLKASQEFALSSNPEAKEISLLCKGWYFREMGVKEKSNTKAKKWLLKSLTIFKKIDPKGTTPKQIELEYLKRKNMEYDNRNKRLELSTLKRSADLFKELGNEKGYDQNMSLYYMGYTLENIDTLTNSQVLENAELMLQHAKRSENKDIVNKVKALYHQIRAKHIFNHKTAIKELLEAKKAINETSDKFGADIADAEYKMAKAMITTDPEKRRGLLIDVGKSYQKRGLKMHEGFVRKLLSPIPLKASAIIVLADQSIEKLKELEKKINFQKGTQKGPFAIFYYIGYMQERIKDVRRIMVRMALTRKRITELHFQENALMPETIIPGKLYPKKLNQILSEIHELTEQMKQDMESLYIYGNLLLDQWSYVIGYISGHEVPDKAKAKPYFYYNDFEKLFKYKNTKKELKEFWKKHKGETKEEDIELNFFGLLSLLQDSKYKGELSGFWKDHKKDIIWLTFHLRFYRNVFIEHLRKPWQRGNTMGAYTDDFNLFIPAPVGYVEPKEEKKILAEIYPLSPQKLRDMPDDYWEKKSLKRVLEVTLNYIDEIDNQADRDKVWNAWHRLGGSTPSYDVIGSRLFNYVFTSIDTIISFIDKHPRLLKLGKFG
jgi:hypothetical protein